MEPQALAQLSNTVLYVAMGVIAAAMIAFTVYTGATTSARSAARRRAAEPELVGVGAPARVGAGAASFANAILRRVGEKDLAAWLEEIAPDPAQDLNGHLAVVHSHPRWVVRALGDALAENTALRDRVASLESEVARLDRKRRKWKSRATGGTPPGVS